MLAVGELHIDRALVNDVVAPHLHLGRRKRYLVLEVTLLLVERVVLVDVLHIRHDTARHAIGASLIGRLSTIALDSVVVLVSL